MPIAVRVRPWVLVVPLVWAGAAAETPRSPVPSPSPRPSGGCEAPESRQFDFWIGEWKVVDRTTGKHAGVNHVERLYGGCALRENWTGAGFRGGSMNTWWRGDGKWHQVWMDQAGAFRHFVGGLTADGRMQLVARQPHPKDVARTRLLRITFTVNGDGTLRQYSDFSDDGGVTWSLRYDLHSTRKD